MASDGNPRWSRRQLQLQSGVVAAHQPEEEYDTFWYFHLHPFRRQALQIRGDGRVQLYSREADFADGRPSGWHGESNWHMRPRNNVFTVDYHCRGEEAAFLYRLRVWPDVGPHVWYAYHADTLWGLLIWAGRLTEHDVQSMLNSSERDRAPLQQADPAPVSPFPRYDERAAPRSPSESPRDLQGQRLMTWLMTSRDNGAPALGFQAFSVVTHRLY